MGSRFTASPEGMAQVMDVLKGRGLLFLDSLTAGNSVAGQQAARSGVPYAVRDVFLDNQPDDPAAIRRQLAILEQIARERGYAIGIGHPPDGTVAALARSEEHTSEPQSLMRLSYAVLCLTKLNH